MLCFMLPFKTHVLHLSLVITWLGVDFQVGVCFPQYVGLPQLPCCSEKVDATGLPASRACVGPMQASAAWMCLNLGLFSFFGPSPGPLSVVTKVLRFWNVLFHCYLC